MAPPNVYASTVAKHMLSASRSGLRCSRWASPSLSSMANLPCGVGTETLKRSYQQADAANVLRVVLEPVDLREAKA